MITRLARQEGQVTVLTAVFIIALVGMAGFVLDVGSWFRSQRVSQATVDAAALAGAESLPDDPAKAIADATSLAAKNGGTDGLTITIGTKWRQSDMITVKQTSTGDGFFSKVLGVSSVTIRTTSSAVSEAPTQVLYAAPIAVNIKHPDLSGPGCPCFHDPTTLPLGKTGAPGSFALINLDQTDTTGTIGASELAAWIQNGYGGYLDIGGYYSDPGAKWNNNIIQDALQLRWGSELLFPVYDALVDSGSNAEYHIIGWTAFFVTSATASGTDGSVSGYFTKAIWPGRIDPTAGGGGPVIPDLGVHSVALVD
jgi:Flp pilus assembly protein TadG